MSEEKCPHCGAAFEGEAKFCTGCGTPREAEAEEVTQPEATAAAPEPEPIEETPSVIEMAEDKKRKKEQKEEVDGAIKPKGSKKGCIIFAVIVVALVIGVPLVIIFANMIAPNIGSRSDAPGEVYDFAYMAEDDFDIWWKAPDGYVTNDNEMAKVHNALCGIKGTTDSDYAVEVTVFVQKVADDDAWAGPVLRVNPKGGDRYAFQLYPNKKMVRITEIDDKGDVKVYAEKAIGQITPGKPYLILAQTEGNDLFLALNDKPLLRASAISLIEGPIGLEARGCIAYFDDLSITEPEEIGDILRLCMARFTRAVYFNKILEKIRFWDRIHN